MIPFIPDKTERGSLDLLCIDRLRAWGIESDQVDKGEFKIIDIIIVEQ